MAELEQTAAEKYLRDRITGEDKARDARGVAKLLELAKQKPPQEPLDQNPLVAQMLRNVRR